MIGKLQNILIYMYKTVSTHGMYKTVSTHGVGSEITSYVKTLKL